MALYRMLLNNTLNPTAYTLLGFRLSREAAGLAFSIIGPLAMPGVETEGMMAANMGNLKK